MDIPPHFRLVFPLQAIESAVQRLADEITPWALETLRRTGRELVVCPVLRGGMVFFADLVRRIPVPLEWEPIRASAYIDNASGQRKREVNVDLWGFNANRRCVLVIDEICDSGRTYHQVCRCLIEQGAEEVRSAALIRRLIQDGLHVPNYVGFEYEGDEWLAGYGLKGGAHYGNLPEIYAVEQPK